MKILLVSAYPPDPAPEANHALHISEQLAKLGHSVHVLCKKDGIASHGGVTVHPIINDWSWAELPRITACLRSCRPDVVLLIYIGWIYNHHPMITFLPTICKAMSPRIPCVTQFEIIDVDCPTRPFMTRLLRKLASFWAGHQKVDWLFGTLLKDSARVIVLSSPHRDRLQLHDADVKAKTIILPPPPLIRICQDPPSMVRKKVREHIGATEDDFVLVYWGYIYPGKGVETLLRAFRSVSKQHPNARLAFVGGKLEITGHGQSCAEYFDMVQRLPEELGIADKVVWTGNFTWDDDMGSQYLHGGDACVLPFDYGVTLNNSSLAAASTHGLPVISTTLSKGRDEALEHGKNIYLCRPRDPEILAEAIQLFIEDPALRERLRQGAQHLAQRWYSWDINTQRLAHELESAIADCGQAGMRPHLPGEGRSRTGPRVHLLPLPSNGNGSPSESNSRPSLCSSGETFPNVRASEPPIPLVSVVVAVHNVDRYLCQCLDALVNQTLPNIEILLVNDASSDRCAEIIESYRVAHPQIKVITCESNKGLATVRNIGLRAATGRYVSFADGDDWVDIRMCEVLYRRASEDHADVVIADATVFYDDTKKFSPFFDQHVRQQLDPRLRLMPFGLQSEPSVLLVEPVAWPKLYDRDFLRTHGLEFEDGMNSYEDVCFHFSVLLKAKRISLIDDRLFYYRQNRPGQISGRITRKIFEVFAVFQKIHDNLTAFGVTPGVWAKLVKVQARQFNWLMKDRVRPEHKREFLSLAARQLRAIPAEGYQAFVAESTGYELTTVECMRNNWLHAYEKVSRDQWPLFFLWSINKRDGSAAALKRIVRFSRDFTRDRFFGRIGGLINKALAIDSFEKTARIVSEKLDGVTRSQEMVPQTFFPGTEPLIEVCRIRDQILFLSRPHGSALGDARWRIEQDYYLTQLAVFREGDVCVDVGAHLGVLSLYLAKKYPFITVYALEPDPVTYECLKRSIDLNRLTNVLAMNKGVSGTGSKKTLYVNSSYNGTATINPKLASSYFTIRVANVETTTLEQLFLEYGISHCRLLKVTAPGAVGECLKGAGNTVAVDLLCGEVDFVDTTLVQLEAASWRIARQHFWRTITQQGTRMVHHWIHEFPSRIDQPQERSQPQARAQLGTI
jgi:FkbM family methyltransferase